MRFAFLLISFLLIACSKETHSSLLNIDSSFLDLQGKRSPHWAYVNAATDNPTIELLEKLYRENRKRQFHPDSQTRVPKVLHCIWLGPKSFPSNSVKIMETWVKYHPDWKFKFWTDRKRPPPCKQFEVCLLTGNEMPLLHKFYDRAENWGEKSDYLRYEILYREGGVYVDHDAEALRSFDNLNHAYDFYSATEAPHVPVDDRAITVSIGLLGVRPHHPILKGCIEAVSGNWARSDDNLDAWSTVTRRSYIAMTQSCLKYLAKDGNQDIVFPASYFFPSKYLPAFYSRHHYATAWLKKDPVKLLKRQVHQLKMRIKHLSIVVYALLAIQILMAGGFVLLRQNLRVGKMD